MIRQEKFFLCAFIMFVVGISELSPDDPMRVVLGIGIIGNMLAFMFTEKESPHAKP